MVFAGPGWGQEWVRVCLTNSRGPSQCPPTACGLDRLVVFFWIR